MHVLFRKTNDVQNLQVHRLLYAPSKTGNLKILAILGINDICLLGQTNDRKSSNHSRRKPENIDDLGVSKTGFSLENLKGTSGRKKVKLK